MALASGSQLTIIVNSVPELGESISYNANDGFIQNFLNERTASGEVAITTDGTTPVSTNQLAENLANAINIDLVSFGVAATFENNIVEVVSEQVGYFDTAATNATGLGFTIENEEITPDTILQEAKEIAQASGSLVEFKRYTYLLGAAYDREKTKNTQFLQLFNELNRTGIFTKEVDAEYTMLPNDKDIDVITANSGTNIILADEVDFTGFQILIMNSTGANLTLNANAPILIEDESGTQQSTYTLGSGIQVGLILKDNIYQLTVI